MTLSVSVVIPCHNAESWISASLNSVAAQTHQALEVIVIDDASTDRSVERIQASGLPVTLLRGPGGNAARARNMGLRAARGDWIAFLDADDVWDPEHLARARALLEGHDDVAYMANHAWMDPDGRPLPMPPGLVHRIPTGRGLPAGRFAEVLADGFHFGHSTVLVRRERSLGVGGFDETQVKRHDIDHWLRVLRGGTWAYEATPSARYRVGHPGGISRDVVGCELYYLRALTLNQAAGFGGPAMDELVKTSARRAMALSFADGDREQFRQAQALAWPHLPRGFRVFYRASALWPRLFQAAIRLKRRAQGLPPRVTR